MIKKNQSGYSLIELLVVAIIISILAVISALIYSGVRKGQINNLQITRLLEYAKAQAKFRDSGRRRYGTFTELCQNGLLADNVVNMDSTCSTQTALNGWVIVPGDESAAYLQNHYFATIKFESRPDGDTTPVTCVGDDVTRRAAVDSPDNCTTSTAPFIP